MRKIYSLMLIAAGLLIGTSLQAKTYPVSNEQGLTDAIKEVVQDGAEAVNVINITQDFSIAAATTYSIYYGKNNYGHKLTINLNGHKISQGYNSSSTPIFRLYNGNLTIQGPGTIESASNEVISMLGYSVEGIEGDHYATTKGNYAFSSTDSHPAEYNVLNVDKATIQIIAEAAHTPMTSSPRKFIEKVLYINEFESVVANPIGRVPGTEGVCEYKADDQAFGVVMNLTDCSILADPMNNGHRCIQIGGRVQPVDTLDNPVPGLLASLPAPKINATNVMFTAGSGVNEVKTNGNLEGATALYGGGVGVWNLTDCAIEGCIAIYAKTGSWNINGCTVHSNSTTYSEAGDASAGSNGGLGCAIIMDNNDRYGTLNGMDIKNTTVVSDAGIAINETITKGDKDNVQFLKVESGTFVGKVKALETTAELKEKIKEGGQITGGEWRSDGGDQHMEDYNNENISSVYYFADGDGNGYQIIIPIGDTGWKSEITENEYVKLENATKFVDADIKVKFLLLKGTSTVTVKAGKVLDAGTLMVENGSQVIVEPSGRLVVSGNQGAYTYNETSLLIKATAEKSGELLIDPLVKINTTPKATVEFVSSSYRNSATDKVYQFFGVPMVNGQLKSIKALNNTYKTEIQLWRGTEWDNFGMLQGSTGLTMSKFNKAFGFFSMLSNNPSGDANKMKYEMTGKLYGNTNPSISIANGWTAMSNGFCGAINVTALLSYLADLRNGGLEVEQTVYTTTYQHGSEGDVIAWNASNMLDIKITDIRPMLPMMFHNDSHGVQFAADYKTVIWNPIMAPATSAPRRAMSNITKTSIRLNHNGYSDVTTIAEGDQFSAEKDFGADAVKYMNEGMNIYVMDEEAMDIFATDNLNNTFIGFTATTAGTYTLSFEKLQGETMTLVDLVNGNQIDMVEGATYDFEAEANEANDYRFQVIRHNTATNLQNAHVGANVMKTMQNGRLMIIKNGRRFDAMGVNVK